MWSLGCVFCLFCHCFAVKRKKINSTKRLVMFQTQYRLEMNAAPFYMMIQEIFITHSVIYFTEGVHTKSHSRGGTKTFKTLWTKHTFQLIVLVFSGTLQWGRCFSVLVWPMHKALSIEMVLLVYVFSVNWRVLNTSPLGGTVTLCCCQQRVRHTHIEEVQFLLWACRNAVTELHSDVLLEQN